MIVTPIQIPALDIKIHDNKVVFTSIATYTRLHRKGYSKIVCKMILYLLQPSFGLCTCIIPSRNDVGSTGYMFGS